MKHSRTANKKPTQAMLKLSAYNESQSFFFAKGVKFQLTRTFESELNKLTMIEVKNLETGKYNLDDNGNVKPMAWNDYLKIINKFRIENQHLKHLMK